MTLLTQLHSSELFYHQKVIFTCTNELFCIIPKSIEKKSLIFKLCAFCKVKLKWMTDKTCIKTNVPFKTAHFVTLTDVRCNQVLDLSFKTRFVFESFTQYI